MPELRHPSTAGWADPLRTSLAAEIHEQPDALRRALTRSQPAVAAVAHAVTDRGVSHVVIAGRGTSDNAARYGQYLLGTRLGLPVALATPSLQTLYGVQTAPPPAGAGTLAIGISQSGRSPDIVAVLASARRTGALTVAITNDPAAPLAREAEFVVPLHVGPERSVAATKTYTASLLALASLTVALHGDPEGPERLRALPGQVATTLRSALAEVPALDESLGRPHLVTVGRGLNYGTAHEIALKIRELSGAMAEAFSPSDLMHGPIAAVGPQSTVIVIAPDGHARASVLEVLPALHDRGARTVLLADGPEAELGLPDGVPEWVSPIVAVVPGQVMALRRAVLTGHAVDAPAGLRKVTETL